MLFHFMHGPFMSCKGGFFVCVLFVHGQHGHLIRQNIMSWDRAFTHQTLSTAARGLWRVLRRLQLRHVATSPFLRHQSNIALVEYPSACADRSRHGQLVPIHLGSRKSSDTPRVPFIQCQLFLDGKTTNRVEWPPAKEWTNRTPISHERTSVHFLVI